MQQDERRHTTFVALVKYQNVVYIIIIIWMQIFILDIYLDISLSCDSKQEEDLAFVYLVLIIRRRNMKF